MDGSSKLNSLEHYTQLMQNSKEIGYEISKVSSSSQASCFIRAFDNFSLPPSLPPTSSLCCHIVHV